MYEYELFTRQGTFLADISKFVKNVHFSAQRNEAEQLEFELNLNEFQDFCLSINVNPTSILAPYQTDVKVKRNGEYLFGCHVGYLTVRMGETSSEIRVKAFGYLNLLIDRYVTETYSQVDATDIGWDLIELTQAQTNGDLGITRGSTITTVDRDRTYVRQNVKEGLVNLTKLVSGNFDFEFTPDKVFNTYEMMGSDRSSELEFIYPRNITEIEVPRDGTALFNKIIGIGSGFGDEALTDTEEDTDSQLNYGVHEKIITFNSVSETETLEDNTEAEKELRKGLLEIPQMSVRGEDFDLNSYWIGDRVTVRIEDNPFLATVNGIYRIERLEVSVDENEAEIIKPYFDNYGVTQ